MRMRESKRLSCLLITAQGHSKKAACKQSHRTKGPYLLILLLSLL